MNEISIMYICDDKFAEVAGISILSLLEHNNHNTIEVTIYLLCVDISEKNISKFRKMAQAYNQKIVFIDATKEYIEIQKLNLATYRGSAMTNLRLHFDKLIPKSVDKILYVDCDTIICGSLTALCEFSLNNKLLAMAYDAYGKVFSEIPDEPYYNAGVMYIDCNKWRDEQWCEKIENFIDDNRIELIHPDQDVLNIVCKNEIACLPIQYNFQVVHRKYSPEWYYQYLAPKCYYSEEEVKYAQESPVIMHMIRYLGTNPWYKDGILHPDYDMYMYYKNKSEWKDNSPQENKVGLLVGCERIMAKLLPQKFVFRISLIAIRLAANLEKSVKKNNEKNRK